MGGSGEKAGERDARTYAIIGAAMAVHTTLGHGFLESVYQEALAVEFDLRAVPHAREVPISVAYKGRVLKTAYRADFVRYESIIVEIKAQSTLRGVDEAQVIHYLKATGYTRALLLNFGSPSLQYRRFVLSPSDPEPEAASADLPV